MSTASPPLNFCGVISVSRRIINAHSRHFLALSVLFLLPLSFSLFIYPTLQSTLSGSDSEHIDVLLGATTYEFDSDDRITAIALPLIYTVFVFILSLCALGTITYSTYHGFYGRPVKLVSAVKSLLCSFIPLVATSIVSELIVALIGTALGLVVLSMIKIVHLLGFEIDYNSVYFYAFSAVALVISMLVLLYIKVNWSLASVIVVVESRWGLEPLRRSTYLVRGMRWVSLSIILFFGALIVFFVWGSTELMAANVSWGFILKTVIGSSLVTVLMLLDMAAMTVLYMYSKAMHGELVWEIVEEFAREYVSLPFDDEKVPHVVYVAQA